MSILVGMMIFLLLQKWEKTNNIVVGDIFNLIEEWFIMTTII